MMERAKKKAQRPKVHPKTPMSRHPLNLGFQTFNLIIKYLGAESGFTNAPSILPSHDWVILYLLPWEPPRIHQQSPCLKKFVKSFTCHFHQGFGNAAERQLQELLFSFNQFDWQLQVCKNIICINNGRMESEHDHSFSSPPSCSPHVDTHYF